MKFVPEFAKILECGKVFFDDFLHYFILSFWFFNLRFYLLYVMGYILSLCFLKDPSRITILLFISTRNKGQGPYLKGTV